MVAGIGIPGGGGRFSGENREFMVGMVVVVVVVLELVLVLGRV